MIALSDLTRVLIVPWTKVIMLIALNIDDPSYMLRIPRLGQSAYAAPLLQSAIWAC